MGKIIKKALPVLAAVAGIALAIPSGGTSLLAAGLGVSGTVAGGIAAGLSISASLLSSTSMPKIPQSETQLSRLQARLDTQAPRKIVLGRTAMPADIRYYEGSGPDERVIEYIIAVAAHKVREISELWIEDELAWSQSGGIAPQFLHYLGVEAYTEGRADNTRAINGGARWGSDDRLTGCAYLYVRVNRLGTTEKDQSPFANGLPGRVTIVGEGMPMYDPRFDSTVGGSGTMRIADQNTWGPSSGNPIIQSLNVLLGWRINGKLSVGGGLPSKYINLDSAMTAANACDEDIVLSGGGTQPRYRTAGTFSTDDAPMNIVGALLAGCAGDLLDSDGQLSFLIKTNTLAVPAVTFDDNDVLTAGRWDAMGGQTNLPNIIAGNFTDPSPRSLYQPVPYRSVKLPSEDGIERTAPLDFGLVENGPQSERLAKQTLQRMQYPGLFSAEYNMKGMAAKVGSIVWQSYSPRAWVNKPFRVVSQKPSRSGRIALILREEHEAIYAWQAEDSAPVQPAEPVRFDPRNTGPILLAREAAKSADWPLVSDTEGTKPEDNATYGAPGNSPVGDRTAEQVTGTLDDHSADWIVQEARNINVDQEIDTAKSDIDDLFATYGFTASAADSATIAQQARDVAQQARDSTLGYVGEVEEDKLAVEGLTTQAVNAKTDAVAAKDGAEGAYAGASTERALAVQASRQSSGGAQTLGRSPGAAIDQWAVNQYATFAPVADAGGSVAVVAGQARMSGTLLLHTVAPTPIDPAKTYFASAKVRRIVDGAQTTGNTLVVTFWDGAGNLAGEYHTFAIASRDSVNVADGVIAMSAKFKPVDLAGNTVPAFARVSFRSPEGGTIEIQELYFDDVDSSERAANSAAASLASESVAIAKATEAGNYASAAQSDRIAAQAANSGAQAQAAIATDKAVIATDAASAAQQQSQLIATYSRAGDNLLANTTLGTTAGWSYAGTISNLIEAGINAAGPVYHPVGENVLSLIQGPHNGGSAYAEWQSSAFPVPPDGYIQPYVFANSHRTSAQLYVIFFNASGGVVGGPLVGSGGALNVPGNDPNNWVRIGTKAIQVPATAISAKLFLRKLDTNPGQSDSYSWFWRPYVGVAQAGQTEWNPFKHGSGKAAEDQSRAEVTIVQGAIASLENSAAFLEVLVAASGGNPAIVRLLGGKNGSAIDLVSDVLRIRNKLNGQLVDVATFEGGVARLNAALIRALAVAPTPQSQIFHRVMLEPLRFTGSHSQTIQYQGGAAYESPPTITRDTTGEVLPALPAGEAYDIRPVNITNSGFAVRAVKLVAGGAATQTSAAGSNVGGTPQWQTNKPTSANASSGDYTFSGTAILSKQGETQITYTDEGNPSTWRYTSSYGGQVQLYGLVGSTWTLLATRNLSRSYTSVGSQAGHDATRSFAFNETVNSNADFGSGANRFGVHPGVLPATTITAFAGVTYNTQTTSSEVALGGTFKFIVSPQTE